MTNEVQESVADLVIVGGGMVGVALACAVSSSGLRILILEQQSRAPDALISGLDELQAAGHDSRVSALTCASQQFLNHVGAWPLMQQQRVSAYTDMEVWDGSGTGEIRFSAAELHEPCLGHIVENRVTLAALYQRMLEQASIQFLPGAELTSVSAPDAAGTRLLTLRSGEVIRAPLLVGADGALSKVRQLTGMAATEWDYGHHALVTSVYSELPHRATCRQRFTEDGPLALLPLDDPHWSSLVWSTSPDHASQLMTLSDEEFCLALERAFDARLGRFSQPERRYVFPLRQRHAHRYVAPGLALIGDAAHTIHPLAGQGVNLGFLDAAALAEVLLAAHAAGESLASERVLRRYQRMRRSDNLLMSAGMEGFRRLFAEQPPLVRLVRSLGMNLADRCGPIKQHLIHRAMGLSQDVPSLAKRSYPADKSAMGN